MISTHTLELRLEVDSETFYARRTKARNGKNYDAENEKDFSYIKKGMAVTYQKTQCKKWIKLIINPSRILGMDDVIELWEPSNSNIKKLIRELDMLIVEYFKSEFELNDFLLSRIDFTKNVKLGNRETVSAYVNFLYNIRKVKGFSPKYSRMDEWYDKNLSFDLKGNSNGIDFTAYDKEAELKNNMQSIRFKKNWKNELKRLKVFSALKLN